MSDLNEVKAAVEGARSVTDLPIVATMTFDTNGHTMMGVSPVKALEELGKLDLVAIGGNCGNGPDEIMSVIKSMRQQNDNMLLVAKANAGLPKWNNNELVFDGTPEVMAAYAVQVRELGARLIGACCGSTPDHVRAMAAALDGSMSVESIEIPAAGADTDSQSTATATRRTRRRKPPAM